MDKPVEFDGRREAFVSRANQRISEILSVLDDAATGPAPDQISSRKPQRYLTPRDEITKGNGRPDPSVGPQYRIRRREKQCFVNRHVFRRQSWALFLNQAQLFKLHTSLSGGSPEAIGPRNTLKEAK